MMNDCGFEREQKFNRTHQSAEITRDLKNVIYGLRMKIKR